MLVAKGVFEASVVRETQPLQLLVLPFSGNAKPRTPRDALPGAGSQMAAVLSATMAGVVAVRAGR